MQHNKEKRKARVRAKISGTKDRPRLTVFRSNRGMYAQLIDDTRGVTLAAAAVSGKKKSSGNELGEKIAKLAVAKKITRAVFDRSGYRFHGAVKEVADAARKGGLTI